MIKPRFREYYMDIADRTALLSRARRLQVGCVIVKDDRIISVGYNGTPSGWDNNCEFEYLNPETNVVELVTKPEVLHAEMNALMKLARSVESGESASLFVTHAPCMNCAKSIYQSGIKEVFYRQTYKDSQGTEFLIKCGIKIESLSI